MNKIRQILKRSVIALAAVVSFAACEDLDTLSDYGWKPEYLGPVVNSNVNYFDLDDLVTTSTDYEVTAGSLEDVIPGAVEGATFPFIPAIPKLAKFDSEYFNFFEFAQTIGVDTLDATISFNNIFPFPMGAETRIVIRDSADPSNVLIDHSVTRDVPFGDSYEFNIQLSDVLISSTTEIFVVDFNSPGTQSQATFSSDVFSIKLTMNILDLNRVDLNPEISYELLDTAEFDIGDIDTTSYAAYDGFLYMFMTNSFPTSLDVQITLINDAGDVEYVFFSDREDSTYVIDAGVVDEETGEVISEVESGKVQLVNIQEDLEAIDRGTWMVVRAVLKTGPNPPTKYVLTDMSEMHMLITADIAIDPSKIETN